MRSPIIETARRVLNHIPHRRENMSPDRSSEEIRLEPQGVIADFGIDIGRYNHPHDFLTLHKDTETLIAHNDIERLDILREAFVGINRNLLMVIDDTQLVGKDKQGNPIQLNVDIYTSSRNNVALANDRIQILEALKRRFLKEEDHMVKRGHTPILTRQLDTIMINSSREANLPIKIQIKNIPGAELTQLISDLRTENGDTFAGFLVTKETQQEVNPDQRVKSLQRNPADFFENLLQPDLDQINKLLFAISCTLPDVTLSEIAVVAEGSTTVPSANYKDIDLRIIYAAHPGNNIDANPQDIASELERVLSNNNIRYSKKRETNYRRVHKSSTYIEEPSTEEEITEEPSFQIIVPETGKFIQVIITGEPVQLLKKVYGNENRTDLPVIISRHNPFPGSNAIIR